MNSQNIHGRNGGAPFDRDRDMEERHRAMQQHEEMRRDQERERERDREAGDRYPPPPLQSTAGSIPIHQPVASRIAGAIHSPGGLLANHNGAARPPPAAHLGGLSGSMTAASFGGPLQGELGRQMPPGGQPGVAANQHQVFAPMPHSQAPPGASQPAPSSAAGVYGGGPSQQQPQPQLLQAQQHQHQQKEDLLGGNQGGQMLGVAPVGPLIPGSVTQGQQPILNVSLLFPRHMSQGRCAAATSYRPNRKREQAAAKAF